MDKKSVISRIEEINNIKFSNKQLDILNSSGGLRVVSGAGAGKTSIITSLLVVKLITGELNPNKVLCATFSKTGALEMKAKFDNLCGKLGVQYPVDFRTLHSMYYNILEHLGYRLNVVTNIQLYVRKALKDLEIRLKPDKELEEYLLNLLSFQINTATGDDKIGDSFVFDKSILDLSNYIKVRNLVAELKAKDGVVDFDDIQKQVYLLLYSYGGKYTNLVLDYCRGKWEHYYIDEFQDTGVIQYKIMNKILSSFDSDKLTVIGDDDQSIYVWRGTNPRLILEDVMLDYKLDTKVIPVNYRCKSNIVDFAANSIVNNSFRQDKDLKAFENGGKVSLILSKQDDYYDICLSVVNQIKKLIDDGNKYSDIAVLCRNNNQMQLLNLMLYSDGFQTKHTSSMKFSDSLMYDDIKSVFKILEANVSGNYISGNLYKFIKYCSKNTSKYIAGIMWRYSCSFLEALSTVLSFRNGDFSSNLELGCKDKSQIEYFAGNLNSSNISDFADFYRILVSDDDKFKIGILLDILANNIAFRNKGDASRRLSGFIKFIKNLADKMSLSEIKELLSDSEKLESASDSFATDKIILSTIHGAKGLEYRNVILLGCDSILFPNKINIYEMLKGNFTSDVINSYIDCERRLYYVGCTRAKERLFISGYSKDICYFVLESLGYNIGNDKIISCVKRGCNSCDIVGEDIKFEH